MMRTESPFYSQFDGAVPYTLVFPGVDHVGPCWNQDGEIVRQPADEPVDEMIEAVHLGPEHYRLACRSDGPLSGLMLFWGDEFIASAGVGDVLTIRRVLMPRAYAHHRLLTRGEFNNDRPEALLVHELGGGWETVARGMLTLTVPSARSEEFLRRMGEALIDCGVRR